MELWILFALAAAVGWAFVVLLDKFVIDSELDDPMGTGGLHAFFNCLAVVVISYFIGGFSFNPGTLFAGVLIGGLYVLANYFWFSGVGSEEVSRFAPVLSFDIVFISVLSFIFLGELLTPLAYAGVALTVLGCILISLEDPLHSLRKMKSSWGLAAALASAFAYSVREVIFKHVSTGIEIWPLLFYFGIMGMLFSAPLIYRSREAIKENTEGLELMMLSGLVSGVAQATFFLAVSLGSVVLVSTITKTRFLLIFFAATAISKLHPEIIHEPLDRKILVQKLVATLLIVIGVAMASI
ncbi:EamA family transporter [Candidatus Nanosalina sp. VS9-1]|uniref:EamA family transporter n=1 Tax=Candidatus Nanosalina sp. VS9-1 TaxID=3388566 RepID=UPI0039E04E72